MLMTLIVSCSTRDNEQYLFDRLTKKETVVIYLGQYNMDSVPKEIGRLKNAKKLLITMDSTNGWAIYPPLSALQQRTETPPFRLLPDEITQLSNLKTLQLVGLNLKTLPDNFGKLENLDSLNLSLNKLTISNEIGKLKKLKKLKYLGLFGNKVDTVSIKELKKENPNLIIESGLE
jgi:Leucine-rich repeat (LRR) protein